MTQYQSVLHPRVDARSLRPRRLWYGIGPGIFALCIVLGVGILVGTIYRVAHNFHELSAGQSTVRLNPDRDTTLYSSQPSTDPSGVGPECTPTGPGEVQISPVLGSETLTTNGTTWYAIAHIHVTKAGDYTASCATQASPRYAIGAKYTVFGLVGGIFAVILIPMGGFLIGGAVVLVTALRRNSHRKRLLAATASGPWPHGWPPGSYGPRG